MLGDSQAVCLFATRQVSHHVRERERETVAGRQLLGTCLHHPNKGLNFTLQKQLFGAQPGRQGLQVASDSCFRQVR